MAWVQSEPDCSLFHTYIHTFVNAPEGPALVVGVFSMRDLVVSPAMGVSTVGGARCGVDARIAPPSIEAPDASRLVCVVVGSYQEYSLTHTVSNLSVLRFSFLPRAPPLLLHP